MYSHSLLSLAHLIFQKLHGPITQVPDSELKVDLTDLLT